MLEKLSVDVWFVFGSFVYGFEGKVSSCEADALEIRLLGSDSDGAQGVALFLEDLAGGAKGLIKSQISIFNDTAPVSQGTQESLRLFTEIAPVVRANAPVGSVYFVGLRGVTSRDHDMWRKLVAGEWALP